MDEGFTNYMQQRVLEYLKSKGLVQGSPNPKPYESYYKGYANLVSAGIEEPLSTHANQFESNTAYGISAYSKGAIFIHQMEYVVGKTAFDKGLLHFYNTWKFKHPDDNDFIRSMEIISGLELDWYKDYMVYSVKTIDYAIDTLISIGDKTFISLQRFSEMPMPIDVVVSLSDGSKRYYTIPLDIMRGAKSENASDGSPFQVLPDWAWVNPIYAFEVPFPLDKVKSVSIDPTLRLADLHNEDNQWPLPKS